MNGAELEARKTAAAAVLADYERATENGISDNEPSWAEWAGRLSYHVGSLLSEPEPLFDVAAGADPFAIPANRIGEPATLESLGQLAVLRNALNDAIAYREPAGICPDCDLHPAGCCADHAEDLDKTDGYLELARSLGLEVQQ